MGLLVVGTAVGVCVGTSVGDAVGMAVGAFVGALVMRIPLSKLEVKLMSNMGMPVENSILYDFRVVP